VQDWLAYRAAQGRPIDPAGEPQGRQGAEDLRRQAVEAWRSLRAKEGESRGGKVDRRELDAGTQSVAEPRSRDRGADFSS